MKDLYENEVFAEALRREKDRDLSPYWVIDHVMPELRELLAQREVTLEITHLGISVRAVDNGRTVYAVPETMPNAEELFTHVMGSGALAHGSEWWEVTEWIGVEENGTVAPDWALRVTYGAEDDDPIEGTLTAASLAQGILRIRAGAVRLRSDIVAEVVLLAEGKLDDVDIDAEIGDVIAQVAICGDARYS